MFSIPSKPDMALILTVSTTEENKNEQLQEDSELHKLKAKNSTII